MSLQTLPVGPRPRRASFLGATGATGPAFVAAGANGPAGVTGCTGPVGLGALYPGGLPAGPVGPTGSPSGSSGFTGFTGSTGPVSLGGPPPSRRDPEHRLEVRLSGSPSEILSMARGWLRGKGHVWQVTGRAMVCDLCLASVLVDPPPPYSKPPPPDVSLEAVRDPRFRVRWDGSRRLLQRRYPGPSDVRSVVGRFPHCQALREALVASVADR